MVLAFFAYFSLVSILAGILTVALRNPVHCGIALLTVLLHVSGLFLLLNAEFLFVVQIIVYAGAIVVLYLFVVMLLNLKSDERVLHHRYAVILIAAAAIGGGLLLMVLRSPFQGAKGHAPVEAVLQDGGSYAIGITIFNEYLLQFEIIGVFLLGAIIGAIVLAKTPTAVDVEPE